LPLEHPLRWYALYTRSRQEKKLGGRLESKGIETYIPLHKTLRQWSDRKKLVAEPLLRSYVFVRIPATQYDLVLSTPGAVRFVWFSGGPAAIPDRQISLLKLVAGAGEEVEVLPNSLAPGKAVRVLAGPLAGLTGELVHTAGRNRVVVRIDHLDSALSLIIPSSLLEMVP
jgi:transcriptional antiterminator RfaH